jgi:hypothetical protein
MNKSNLQSFIRLGRPEMTTSFKTQSNGDVTISREYFDGLEMVTDTTTYTKQGSYVYQVNPNGTTSQVCEGLLPTGNTLMAGNDLEATLRRTLKA